MRLVQNFFLLIFVFVFSVATMHGDEPVFAFAPTNQEMLTQLGVPIAEAIRVSGLSSEGLSSNSLARFEGTSDRSLRIFVSRLSELRPTGVSVFKQHAYVTYRGNIKKSPTGRIWELHFPVDFNNANDQFRAFRDQSTGALMKSVNGIRCSLEFGRGFLTTPDLASQWSKGFDIDQSVAEQSFVIFHASNGDMLLSDKDGTCGWLVLEMNKYISCQEDYLRWFVENFIDILNQNGNVDFWSVKRYRELSKNVDVVQDNNE